jgi:hypothetical protein
MSALPSARYIDFVTAFSKKILMLSTLSSDKPLHQTIGLANLNQQLIAQHVEMLAVSQQQQLSEMTALQQE